jgi:hypothetical protein
VPPLGPGQVVSVPGPPITVIVSPSAPSVSGTQTKPAAKKKATKKKATKKKATSKKHRTPRKHKHKHKRKPSRGHTKHAKRRG